MNKQLILINISCILLAFLFFGIGDFVGNPFIFQHISSTQIWIGCAIEMVGVAFLLANAGFIVYYILHEGVFTNGRNTNSKFKSESEM